MKKIKILFFTPSYSRGGSEMYLYYLLNKIDQSKFEIQLYVDGEGELTKETHNYPIYIKKTNSSSLKRGLKRLVKKLFNIDVTFYRVKKINQKYNPDLWYFNTSIMTKYHNYANELKMPYIIHFHELYSVYDNIFDNDFVSMIRNAKAIIACSSPVKQMIENVRSNNVYVQYEHIHITDSVIKTNVREKYNIPDSSFVWLMSGQKNYRKGYDITPQILNFLKSKNAYFIWLGANRNYWINQLIKAADYDNFVEPGLLKGDEYHEIWTIADGFVLTSREDPFPLVMIEAASKKIPIIACDSGGVKEFVEEGMGKVIEGYDVNKLLIEMNNLMDGKISLDKDKLSQKSQQYDVKIKTEEWQELLMKIMHTVL